ncbi:MAG: hypothetical protein ACLF0G_15460 [Candidatus Brocadiia bacterium]
MDREALKSEIHQTLDRWLEASSTLIAVHLFAAGAEMVWMAVEAAAGYFVGSQARSPSKASILRFARAYLPELGRTGTAHLALADHPDRPLASCAELLYECFHGGLFHDGQREAGVRCRDDKHKWMLSLHGDGDVELNVIPFQAQLERGMKQYLRDLDRDEDLAERAEARSAFLARPVLIAPERRALGEG